jgi:uncharacterized protein
VALEMKMRCTHCERPLSPGGDAFICSFECTYCVECAEKFDQVCPNCSGELVLRPRRKASAA